MNRESKRTQPIGIFDSGIGGLTVANAVIRALPNEEIIYFGDTAHLPYGDKSADAIRYYCIKIVKFLLDRGCKMIVIACNSASSAAYQVLLDFFEGQTSFVNVVDPLVEAVVGHQLRKVGVIATKATIRSDIYRMKLIEKQPGLQVASLATPLLVPVIEEGYFNDQIGEAVVENYLNSDTLQGIEALLLACTHYPLIRQQIEKIVGPEVKVFDSIDVASKVVEKRLREAGLLNDQQRNPHQFFVSDYTNSFEETTRIFFDQKIELKHCAIW